MFNKLRSFASGAVEGMEGPRSAVDKYTVLQHKHSYTRPAFLNLSQDALAVSRDKNVRPVLSSSSSNPLPNQSGYAECVNAGKSYVNEDMAQVYSGTIKYETRGTCDQLDYQYYGIFDGHAGFGAALDASKQMHHVLHQKLVDSIDTIVGLEWGNFGDVNVDAKAVITGCLETTFSEMDEVIKESRKYYYNPGGCTAIVALFIQGHLYVANAGDCRAAICDGSNYIPMSYDYSPAYDKLRIYRKAADNIALLGDRYTVREFLDTPTKENLGKLVLFKDPHMTGWSFKTLSSDDLKLPLIGGYGRRSRIMGTIGVARGFGDFDLTSNHYKIPIKPFLSCIPEVKVFDISTIEHNNAVLVMGSDGLWDAVDRSIVMGTCDPNKDNCVDRNVNITKAMNLVAAARGRKDSTTNMWMSPTSTNASLDDISVFVIYMRRQCNVLHLPAKHDNSTFGKRIPIKEISDTESGSSGSPLNLFIEESEGSPECDINVMSDQETEEYFAN